MVEDNDVELSFEDVDKGPGLGGHHLNTEGVNTRASAQRVTNTPGRRHFLIIKYFKVNDNDIRQDIVYNVSL